MNEWATSDANEKQERWISRDDVNTKWSSRFCRKKKTRPVPSKNDGNIFHFAIALVWSSTWLIEDL